MGTEVQDIKDRLNIVDIIGEYVRLTKAGSNFKGLCPFHSEKSPSFMVSEERQSWHCFGCSKGGDIYTFLMEQEGMEFREALKVLAERAGVELKAGNREQGTGNSTKQAIEILEVATQFYEKQLWDGDGQKKALPYLRDRGISDESIKEFRLGYAPEGWDHILKFLSSRGYSLEEIEDTGLLVKKDSSGEIRNTKYEIRFYDRFRDRIMFPITDVLGRVIGYSARVLPGADEKHAKYINTPESSVYRKSKVLYGISQAKQAMKSENRVILVEGNMDVIAMHQAGFRETVAVSGTALTLDHVNIIRRYAKSAVLFFDMDTAGQSAARKSAEVSFRNGLDVSIVSLEEGKDAAELAREDVDALRSAIGRAHDAFSYFLEGAMTRFGRGDPQSKKRIVEDITPLLRAFENGVERSAWAHEVAERIGVEDAVLMGEVNRGAEKTFVPRGEQSGEGTSVPETSRLSMLRSALTGLMLSDSTTWKHIDNTLCSDEYVGVRKTLMEDEAARYVLEYGKAVGYDFDSLRAGADDGGMVRKLQEIFAKQDILSEEDQEVSAVEQGMQILRQILDEQKKQLRARLIAEMSEAEQSGDVQKQQALRREFVQLTQVWER